MLLLSLMLTTVEAGAEAKPQTGFPPAGLISAEPSGFILRD